MNLHLFFHVGLKERVYRFLFIFVQFYANHIAVATVNRIESLASWNFKHIVSINPIRKIHEINSKEKHQIIEIGSLEIYGGAKYGTL